MEPGFGTKHIHLEEDDGVRLTSHIIAGGADLRFADGPQGGPRTSNEIVLKPKETDSVGSGTDNLPLKAPNGPSQSRGPGRVLLVRGLHSSVTEDDLQNVISPFNQNEHAKIFLRPLAGQAFVEFENEVNCATALQYLKQNDIMVKGSLLRATPSRREQVTRNTGIGGGFGKEGEAGKVVLVTVNNIVFRVDLETIYGIVKQCGVVERIVCFCKSPLVFQALVQYRSRADAQTCIAQLHNRTMYEGCNTLQVVPSHLSEVTVANNDRIRSWDFSLQPDLEPTTTLETINEVARAFPLSNANVAAAQQLLGGHTIYDAQTGGLVIRGAHPRQQQTLGAMSTAGGIHRMVPLISVGDASALSKSLLSGQSNSIDAISSLTSSNLLASGLLPNQPSTPVIICYNLPHERLDITKLFNLFSLYGCLARVKILKDKADTALMQYTHPVFAQLARSYLHEVEVYNHQLQIASSKNWEVKMPMRQDADDEDTPRRTVEFSRKDQRHKMEDIDKYARSACRPTATLFVANIGESVSEADIVHLLTSTIAQPQRLSMRDGKAASSKKFAIVSMPSISDAIHAVCTLHNYVLDGSSLKIAFSKMILQ
eukprot:GHVN01072698.1.p1 GENE.GHVN01072698.1~~GHVN01072698.1.p1  ORF type:complete len:597 (+),score=69.71 GHVN01072698.1:144-1934(+)